MKNSKDIKRTEKNLITLKSTAELFESAGKILTQSDPRVVLKNFKADLDEKKEVQMAEQDSNVFKALTLHEFDKGILMSASIPPQYETFAIDLLRKLKDEFKCVTTSEMSLAENVTINFIRTIEIEKRLTSYLNIGSITQNGVNYLNVMSKELDRANRHYLTALQALKSIKQPNLSVNIKTQTAVVGQNQLVQSNNHD
jgi:hypothetical protein